MKSSAISRCLVLMIFFLAVGGWTAARADVAVTDGFEIGDGDIHDNTPPGGLNDWENCNCTAIDSCNADVSTANTPGGSAVVSDQTGKTDPSYFTIGSTKDFNDLRVWHHAKPSNPVDKDDIVNAYALQYLVPDTDGTADQLIYVGGDRFDNNGSAFIGAWFFQNPVCQGSTSDQFFSDTDGDGTCGNNGAPLATHKDGDLLILAEFDKGGTVGTVKLERWVGSGSGTPADLCAADGGTLNAKHPESICDLAPNSLFASGIQNSAAQVIGDTNGDGTADVSCSSDWSYKQKGSKVSGVIGVNDFFEVGANLSHFPGLAGTCFATFLLETRSSFEIDAILKDYVLHSFAPCGIVCNKTVTPTSACQFSDCAHTNANSITYTNEVGNIQGGSTLLVKLCDDNGTPGIASDDFCIDPSGGGACVTSPTGSGGCEKDVAAGIAACPSFTLGTSALSCTRSVTPASTGTTTNSETAVVVSPTGVKGCSAQATVEVNPNPSVTISAITCNAPSTSFTLDACATGGTGTITYSWNTGDTSSSITKNIGGAYSVTVTDANGCQGCASTNVGYCTVPSTSSCP